MPSRNIEPPCGAVRAEAGTHASPGRPSDIATCATQPTSYPPVFPAPSHPSSRFIVNAYTRTYYVHIHYTSVRAGTSRRFNFYHRPGHPFPCRLSSTLLRLLNVFLYLSLRLTFRFVRPRGLLLDPVSVYPSFSLLRQGSCVPLCLASCVSPHLVLVRRCTSTAQRAPLLLYVLAFTYASSVLFCSI